MWGSLGQGSHIMYNAYARPCDTDEVLALISCKRHNVFIRLSILTYRNQITQITCSNQIVEK